MYLTVKVTHDFVDFFGRRSAFFVGLLESDMVSTENDF